MAKRLVLNDSLKAAIIAAAGDADFDFNKIVAYESVAASTRPITQRSSPYHDARMTETYLREMASSLTSNSVTLQIMHNNEMLPIGKVFLADVFEAEAGHFELNAAFYLESDSEYVSKLDLSIIDEVSVGTMAKHAYCSQCDFDYMTDPIYLYYRECPNDHVLGQEGVHLRLTNMDFWKELSLVNKGASSKPKILGSAKQRLGQEGYRSLAASNSQLDLMYLASTPTLKPETKPQTGAPMDPAMLELAQKTGRLESEKQVLEASLSTTKQSLETAQAKVVDLEAQLAAEKSKQPEELTTLKASAEKVSTFLTAQYKVACVAAGLELKEGATTEEMISALDAAQVKLAAIPRGGVTQPSDSVPAHVVVDYVANAAFCRD